MKRDVLQAIARELKTRGAVDEALELEQIASVQTKMQAPVVEAVRLLNIVQEKASKEPALMSIAARASLLNHQIQKFYG